MFKKVMVGVISASMIMSSMVAVAAPFGKSSSSRASSSSASSSRGSSFSRPASAPTRSAPSSASSSRNYGGISQGGSVGMTRSDVSNRVRNGTNVAPRNESTVAGNNPSGSYNSGSRNSGAYGNNSGYNSNSGYNNNNRYNNGYNNGYNNAPSRGHSTGALIGAAAAGAIGGYMLNGILHNSDGSVHNGPGYQNGVPVQSNAGAAQPTMNSNGAGYSNGSGYNTAPAMGAAPVVVKNETSFWWSLLGFLLVVLVLAVLWKLFFGRKKTHNSGVDMFNSVVSSKSPEAEIRDMKDQMFINFQKNNKPSGLSYIQNNSTPMLFEAIREMVETGQEGRSVNVKSLESKLEDITQDGSTYVASVSYKGVLVEKDVGHEAVETPVYQLWNYTYDGRNWKLAGIEELG